MEILEESGVSNPDQEDSTKIEADFDENCYLAAQAYYFVDNHFRNTSSRATPIPLQTVYMAHNFFGRDNNNLDPSIPSKLMNRLDLADFVYAEPKLFSLLYPKIELYRVDYVNEGGNNTEVDRLFLIPQETNSKYSMYTDVLNKKIAGAGVKSLNWTIAGSNPAAAEKLVDLEINFEFSNALELGGGELNNILQYYIKGESFPFLETDTDHTTNNFLSLILFPQGKRDEYNGKFYRLKAKLGWQYVTEDMLIKIGYNEDKAKKLAIALSKQSIVIMLNLISHSFDITEEGSVSLQTKYQASFEQAVDSGVFDIFYRHNVEKDKLKDNVTLKNIQDRISSINSLLDSSCIILNSQQKDSLRKTSLENLRKELKEEQDKQAESLKEIEIQAKNSFMRIFRSNSNKFDIYNFTVGNEDILSYEKYLEDINNGNKNPFLTPPQNTSFSSKLTLDEKIDVIQADYEVQTQNDSFTSKVNSLIVKSSTGTLEGVSKFGEFFAGGVGGFGENVWVNFVYLYDILNVLYICLYLNAEKAHSNDDLKKQELIKDLSKYKIVLGDYKTTTGKIINLGELPISFTVFHEWYMNNIAKTDVTNYTLQSFIYSLFNDIVAKSLGASCVNGANLDNKVSIGFVTYSLEHKINEEPLTFTSNKNSSDRQYVNLTSDPEYTIYKSCLVAPDDLYTPKETTNYLYVYSKQLGCELTGLINDDIKKGIYHFYIGQTEGIHKSIKFKRIDQPYLKEARATKEDSFVLGQLREVYNVDLTTVGNTVFYPGMVIYIHPPIEFGAVTEKNNFAYLMGIGGYYSVIKVQSVIDQDKFETSLECVYLSSGVCEEEDLCDPQTPEGETKSILAKLESLKQLSNDILIVNQRKNDFESITETELKQTKDLIDAYNAIVNELGNNTQGISKLKTDAIISKESLDDASKVDVARGYLTLTATQEINNSQQSIDENIQTYIDLLSLLAKAEPNE